jgi:hypothetical protein
MRLIERPYWPSRDYREARRIPAPGSTAAEAPHPRRNAVIPAAHRCYAAARCGAAITVVPAMCQFGPAEPPIGADARAGRGSFLG